MNNDIKRGEEIILAIYKASLSALFSIGVRSSYNVDIFTSAFSNELYKEFERIGLLKTEIAREVEKTPIDSEISKLGLNMLITSALKKAGIVTIIKLIAEMQKDSLRKIRGIGLKSENQIIQAIKAWNQST